MNYELRMKSMLLTGICLWLSLTATAATANRTITKAEAVSVEVPVGHAPRLPYRVWVHYSDGRGEYRQVKWQNSSLVREQAEADPTINPAGTEYKVKGFVTGDNTTANGYPVTALVKVTAKEWEVPSNRAVAETLPLDKVAISGNNRLTWNRNMDIDHLLTLDVRQQLYNYRDTYGLPTEGYPEADGWDSQLPGRGQEGAAATEHPPDGGLPAPVPGAHLRMGRAVGPLLGGPRLCPGRRTEGDEGHVGRLQPLQAGLPPLRLWLPERHSCPALCADREVCTLQQRERRVGTLLFCS